MIGKIKPYNSFGATEYLALVEFIGDVVNTGTPLSGYLAGRDRGGYHVFSLETRWAATFGVKHAIACNSATSGLLAAAFAVGLAPGDTFICPAMTMSATAAAPMFTGATPHFMDVDEDTFSLNMAPDVLGDAMPMAMPANTKTMLVTNLFGHPARLIDLRRFCDAFRITMIEDNSQSPFAMEHGKYAGTIGHIGVFSLNVHKHIQCGEGGVIVTDDDELAARMRAFINHGEHVSSQIGLNLRMTELSAAVALAQLQRGPEIVARRIAQAEAIIKAIGHIPGIRPPVVRDGCSHVYYTIPFLIDGFRAEFCSSLRDQGVPIVEGYVEPLYRMSAFAKFARPCPVAEDLHDRRLFYIENCAYDFTPEQIGEIGTAFRRAAETVL